MPLFLSLVGFMLEQVSSFKQDLEGLNVSEEHSSVVCQLSQTNPPCFTSYLVTSGIKQEENSFLNPVMKAVPVGETAFQTT